jgi:hypothetical protein
MSLSKNGKLRNKRKNQLDDLVLYNFVGLSTFKEAFARSEGFLKST